MVGSILLSENYFEAASASSAEIFNWLKIKSVLTAFSLLFDGNYSNFELFLRVSVVSNLLNMYSGSYCVRTEFVVVYFPTLLSIVIAGSVLMHFSAVSPSSLL